MSMSVYPKISEWRVPSSLLSKSLVEMRTDGNDGNEGICLWLGLRYEEKETAEISHVVRLRGPGVSKKPDQIQIHPELIRDVHYAAQKLDRILVGQIHSHGTAYGIGLSSVDIEYGISVPYYLSVVAPHYALRPKTEWKHCGVHVYVPQRGYLRVPSSKIIIVERSLPLEVLTVGDEPER